MANKKQIKTISRIETIAIPRPRRVIYFLINKSEIVYVGQSISIESRLLNHQKDKAFDEVMVIEIDKNDCLNTVEDAFIKLLSPRLNKRLPRMSLGEEDARIYRKYRVNDSLIDRAASRAEYEVMRPIKTSDRPPLSVVINSVECGKLAGKVGTWDDTEEDPWFCDEHCDEEIIDEDCEVCGFSEMCVVYLGPYSEGYYLLERKDLRVLEKVRVVC